MKVAACSDIHLEFGGFPDDHPIYTNPEQADVLVLSGDIYVAQEVRQPKGEKYFYQFIERCSKAYNHVVYVLGNHEHYNGDIKYSADRFRLITESFDNVYLLDDECAVIDDVLFVGGTMWTDMNSEDPLTLYHMRKMMNDFRIIKNSNRSVYRNVPIYEYNEDGSLKKDEKGYNIPIGQKKKEEPGLFSPEDSVEAHKKFLQYLQTVIMDKHKVVVCTHHTPSFQSCHDYYKHDQVMNGAYHSHLDFFIENHPQIKLWIHGHTHNRFDYVIGETRIVCNPRGYIRHESIANSFVPKVIDV